MLSMAKHPYVPASPAMPLPTSSPSAPGLFLPFRGSSEATATVSDLGTNFIRPIEQTSYLG